MTAAELNSNIRDSVNFLLAAPRVVAGRQTSTGWAAGGTPSAFPMDLEVVDSDTMFTPTSARITCHTAGLFEVGFYIHWVYTSNASTFHCGVALNSAANWFINSGNNRLAEDTRTGSNNSALGTSVSIVTEVFLNVNDYVEFFVATTGAMPSPAINAGQFNSQATARWVASS